MEQLIVGAGLSGMVASILLARRGYKVRVLEKYKTVGGQPERWPAVDVTPMAPELLSKYLGIEIGEPQVKQTKALRAFLWGERFRVPLEGSNLCCVERGPRKTGLDGYLWRLAESEGVKFEFECPVSGQGALSVLTPRTIIATGLYVESFDALRIPYQMGWCYGLKGHTSKEGEAAIFFGDYTTDYGYWSCMNGIDMVFLFRRGPISPKDLGQFEKEIKEEGLKGGQWLFGYGPTPTASFSNPRLFCGNKILAGTLAGMIEPFVLFGVHGALVSGKISAMAVEDANDALREFKKALFAWKRALLARKVYDKSPQDFRKQGVIGINRILRTLGPSLGGRLLEKGFSSVPGYRMVVAKRYKNYSDSNSSSCVGVSK